MFLLKKIKLSFFYSFYKKMENSHYSQDQEREKRNRNVSYSCENSICSSKSCFLQGRHRYLPWKTQQFENIQDQKSPFSTGNVAFSGIGYRLFQWKLRFLSETVAIFKINKLKRRFLSFSTFWVRLIPLLRIGSHHLPTHQWKC